jgi:acyl-CoA reductase-like NAD-dependent aldehyde dehydrogenase
VFAVQWHPEFHPPGDRSFIDDTPLLDDYLRHAGCTRPPSTHSRDPMKIINPATGATLAVVAADGHAAVRRKYEAARAAQPAWAALSVKKRLDTIRRFRERVVELKDTLAQTLTNEVGKPIRQSRNELNGLTGRIDFFLSETARTLRDETVFTDGGQKLEERISHEPLGVIANISAWNYPYFVGGNVFVPALAAGNAVLYKPSEFATLTGLHIAEMLHDSGVPEGRVCAGDRRCDDGYRTASPAARRRVLHRVVRDRREDRRVGRPPDDQGSARARRQGPDLRLRRCRRRRHRGGRRRRCVLQHRPIVLLGRADLRARGDPRRVRRRLRRRGQGLQGRRSARRATYIGAITRAPQLDVLQAGRRREEERRDACCSAATSSSARATGSQPTVLADVDHTMA